MGCKRINPSSAIRHWPSRHRRRAAGFTLIEAALTTVIVGTGVLAIVAAQQAYHMKNDWAQRTGTAQHLANELRELTLTLPMYHPVTKDQSPGLVHGDIGSYNCVYDFAGPIVGGQGQGVTFGKGDAPPVNALREEYVGLEQWSQHVKVHRVYDDWFDISDENAPPLDPQGDALRVTVSVRYHGPRDDEPRAITRLTWVVVVR